MDSAKLELLSFSLSRK